MHVYKDKKDVSHTPLKKENAKQLQTAERIIIPMAYRQWKFWMDFVRKFYKHEKCLCLP